MILFVELHRFRFPRDRHRRGAGQSINLAIRRDPYVHWSDRRRGGNLFRHSRKILRRVHLIRPHRYRSKLTIDIRQSGIQRSERRGEMGMGGGMLALLDWLLIGLLLMLRVVVVGRRRGGFDRLSERDEEVVQRFYLGARIIES